MIASSATAGQPARPSRPGELALVHLRVLGEPGLLGVLRDHAVERLDVLQRPAHQHRVAHALAVVGEDPDPGRGVGHRPELGQSLAGQPDGDRADGVDVAVAGLAAQPPHLLDHAGGVGDRLGVGHRVHGGEPAQRRGAGAGLDGLGVLPAGLAEVGVQVDQAGQRDQPGAVDGLDTLAGARYSTGVERDDAVLEHQVGRLRPQDGHVPDQVAGAHSSFSSMVVDSDPLSSR